MAEKTYLTHRPSLAVAWERATDIPGKTKNVTLNFVNGSLTTEDEAEQKYIEELPTFADGTISLKTAAVDIAVAEAKAKALRAVANKAEAEAIAAESALAALQKSAAPASA